VVRQLQDVRAERRSGSHQRLLGASLHVPGQQHPTSAAADGEDEGAVVARKSRSPPWGPERLHDQVADHRDAAVRATFPHVDAAGACDAQKLGPSFVCGGAGWNPDFADRVTLQDGRQAPAVVRVGVARDDDVDATHAEGAQGRGDDAAARVEAARARGASVDEQRPALPLDEDGVSLADVDEDHPRRLEPAARCRGDQQHESDR